MRTLRDEDRWHVETEVYLGELKSDHVEVQLYANPLMDAEAPTCVVMSQQEAIPGAVNGFIYTAECSASRPADHYTPRIVPFHPDALPPLEEPLIVWKRWTASLGGRGWRLAETQLREQTEPWPGSLVRSNPSSSTRRDFHARKKRSKLWNGRAWVILTRSATWPWNPSRWRWHKPISRASVMCSILMPIKACWWPDRWPADLEEAPYSLRCGWWWATGRPSNGTTNRFRFRRSPNAPCINGSSGTSRV